MIDTALTTTAPRLVPETEARLPRGPGRVELPALEDVPARLLQPPVTQRGFLIDGVIHRWEGALQQVDSPVGLRDGDSIVHPRIGSYPLLTGREGQAAVEAASTAYGDGLGTWPSMSSEERIGCVERFLDAMVAQREKVAKLLMWEVAKSEGDSLKEFDRTVQYVRATIGELRAMNREGEASVELEGTLARVERQSRGVVLCMGPFNYPLNETFTTLIPALLMGNTVVFKPPKQGVLLFEPLLEAFRDSFPKGVINTVYGDGKEVISPVLQSGKVDVLAFIGSSQVASILMKQHPMPNRLHAVLGLGAKNPGVVLPDADLDRTVNEVVTGALSYNGQRCTALKVLFVHRSIAPQFVEKLGAVIDALPLGAPWEKGVKITPLAEPSKVEYLESLIEDAAAHGARIRNDGGRASDTLFKPAVLYPVAPEARVYREEQFGPLVPVVPYDAPDEIVRYVRESSVAQQASIFGTDSKALVELAAPLMRLVSRVNVNTQCQRGPDALPFTGRKDSATGTLSIRDALLEFSQKGLGTGSAKDPVARAVLERLAA